MMSGTRGSTIGFLVALALAAAIAASADTAPSPAATHSAAATLDLRAELRLVSTLGACPPGVSAGTCAARTGEGVVRGLGSVTESYTFQADIGPPSCNGTFGKTLAYAVRFIVASRGEIHFALAQGAECVDEEAVRTQTQAFTVTGGTGAYAGASGSGTVARALPGLTPTGRTGTETWIGTLDVPGLDFDVTPPTLTGAVSKTIRAPRRARSVRVTYGVSAGDAVDGAVPVSCRPRSGSRFPIGRTAVICSASDTSGNTQTAKFSITVKRRR